MILLQSVRLENLLRLSEAQLTLVNTQLETELLTNATIKRELGNKIQDVMKGLGGGQSAE
jgi:hypothetical protein